MIYLKLWKGGGVHTIMEPKMCVLCHAPYLDIYDGHSSGYVNIEPFRMYHTKLTDGQWYRISCNFKCFNASLAVSMEPKVPGNLFIGHLLLPKDM